MTDSENVKDILYQQLEMLAEESRKTDSIETKLKISAEIDRIADTLLIRANIWFLIQSMLCPSE